MNRLPILFASLVLIGFSAFPGEVYAASGKKFEGAARDRYIKSCDAGNTPVLAMDKKRRWGASFHSTLARAKQLAVSECSAVSSSPLTCKVVDVGCESDLFRGKSSTEASESGEKSGNVLEHENKFICLIGLKILQSEESSRADCRDQGGTPFVTKSYAQVELDERKWRASQGIEFSSFIRAPMNDESGTCAAPEVDEPSDWEVLKGALKKLEDGSTKSNQAKIRFEGDCWPAGQWLTDGQTRGRLSAPLLVPKKEPVTVRIVSDGVIVFERALEKPQGETVISGRQSKADKELLALKQKRDKQALEKREAIRLAEEAERKRKEEEKRRLAQEKRQRIEEARKERHAYVLENKSSITLSGLAAHLASPHFQDRPRYVDILNTWFARSFDSALSESSGGNSFDALRKITRTSGNVPLERLTSLPPELTGEYADAWRFVLENHKSLELAELESYRGVPILARDKELVWFFNKADAGGSGDYQKLLGEYLARTVVSELSDGLSLNVLDKALVDTLSQKNIDFSRSQQSLVNTRQLQRAPDDDEESPPFDLEVVANPSRILKIRSEELENLNQLKDLEYPAIVYRLQSIDLDRDVTRQQSIGSKFIQGYQEQQNPEYVKAHREMQIAYQELVSASNTPNPDFASVQRELDDAIKVYEKQRAWTEVCRALKASSSSYMYCAVPSQTRILSAQQQLRNTPRTYTPWKYRRAYEQAQSTLRSTSQTITVPVFQPYQFRSVDIEVTRSASIEIFVLRTPDEPISYSSVDKIIDVRHFSLAYGVHGKDPDKAKHLSGITSEEHVQSVSSQSVRLVLNDVPLRIKKKADTLDSISALQAYLAGESEKPSTDQLTRSSDVETAYIQDERLQSVVIVRNLSGGLGSGFFVESDLILTNYHVIDGANFAEIETLDGTKETGKVVEVDIRLDLALVKVDLDGSSVEFSDGIVALGDTVHAIGHPSGMTYTLTEGIISSIRRLPSSYDPGGPPLLFVQTDVAINPGNSGGPLYVGDKVIGVNTKKLAKVDVEGLAFSVHVSEVMHFLEDFRQHDK